MIFKCSDCGVEAEYDSTDEAYDNDWWQDDNGDWYCRDCYSTCVYCDETLPLRELEWSSDIEGHVCESCSEEHCVRCPFCNKLLDDNNCCRIVDNDCETYPICNECLNEHERAGRIFPPDDPEDNPHFDGSVRMMREGMRERERNRIQYNLHPEVWQEISNCDECRELGYKCSKCLRKEADEQDKEKRNLWLYDVMPRAYHDPGHYHFKETPLLMPHENPFLKYGVERELLFKSREPIEKIVKEYIEATKGLFVAEFDRSVTTLGNGIEFISRALSYKMWMDESTYQLLVAGEEVLRKYGAYTPQPDGCGIHVHMSLKFFERNTKKSVKEIKSDLDWILQVFQSEVEKISDRKYTKYCASKAWRAKEMLRQLRNSELGFNLKPRIEISKGELTLSRGSGATHHDAIIQTNKTIEVRTFKSTTSTTELLAYIEFCRAIAHAARNMTLDKNTTLGDIIWCKDSKYLPELIKKRKVDTSKKFANKLEVKL